MVRVRLIAAVVAVQVLVPGLAPGTAVAADPLPAPALAQYVESIPTSSGPVVTAVTKPTVKKLPVWVQEQVAEEGGTDASVIEQIATSSSYGAPQTTLTRRPAKPALPERPAKPAVTAENAAAPSAAAKGPQVAPKPGPSAKSLESPTSYYTDGSGGSRLPVLALLLLAATVGLVVASRRVHA